MSDDSHDAGRDQPVVYIVDDERAVRESLEDLLASAPKRWPI